MRAKRRKQALLRGTSLLREDKVDLTPLIDCVFMLLIFFMVTTVFITTKGLNVDLPKSSSAETQAGKDINLIVEEGGSMEINGEAVTMEELPERIGLLKDQLQTRNMILQAHPSTMHAHVVQIIDIAHGQGIEGVAFAREL